VGIDDLHTEAAPAQLAAALGARALARDVRGERLTPELGEARLHAQEEERALGREMTASAPELHGRRQRG
jgi:hypothetical protein